MTVTAAPSVNNHVGNGVTTVFAYGFKILAAADLRVTVNGVVVTNYTVTGVRNPTGGTITFTVAPSAAAAIRLARAMPLLRATDYQFNGNLPSDTLNDDQDAPVLMIQQLNDQISRSLRVSESDTTWPIELPNAATRANKLLAFDSAGQPQALSSTAQSAVQLALDLASSIGSSMVGFIQAGTGAVARPVASRLSDIKSILDYGVGGAATFTSVEALADKAFYVPEGNYASGRNHKTQLAKRYWGPGTILDASNRKRGRYFSSQSTPLGSRGNTSDEAVWFAGDYSNSLFPIEHVINVAPVQTGTLVLSANASAGATVLTFASVPSWVGVGARDVDPMGGSTFFGLDVDNVTAPSTITAGTKVVNISATTVTLGTPLAGAVSAGQTIRFGWGQYIQPFEANPINVMFQALPGSLNANQSSGANGSGGQVVFGMHITGKNSAGGGGVGGFHALINVDQPFTGYNSANPYNTATGFLLSGQVAANCPNTYLSGIEYVLSDNNFASTAIGLVLNAERQNAGGGAHQFWRMIQFNGSAFLPVDSWMGGNAKARYGLDLTNGDFSTNFDAAIAMKAGQRIFFDSTVGTYGATAVGGTSVRYNSGTGRLQFDVAGSSASLQVDANSIWLPSGGTMKINGVTVVAGRVSGWAAATGTATRTSFATGSVTLPQLAERVKAVIDDLITHGLIGA